MVDELALQIFDSMEQGILVFDTEENLLYWNEHITSYFMDEKNIPKTLHDLFPQFWEEYRGVVWGTVLLQDVIIKGLHKEMLRFPITTKDNEIRYFDLKSFPLKKKDHSIDGAVICFLDATENLRLENQLLRQARTKSLANLGASIAHEIRNPLNSISLNIQLIREWLSCTEENNQDEILETVQNVLNEINRLNDLIRDFLQFSRPADPQKKLQNPNEAVEQAMRLINENARRADVDVILSLSALPEIYIDKNQIAQAVYNIALNAIQSIEQQGGGRLEVSTFQNKDYCLIEIKDNGMGLPAHVYDKLFDLFYTTKEDGSGLGLPIANQIVENHDGRIVAENNLDRGACFSIYLPTSESKE